MINDWKFYIYKFEIDTLILCKYISIACKMDW